VVADVDQTVATFAAFTLVFSGILSAFAGDRVFALVESAVREQRRSERLGRYFSPGVVALLDEQDAEASGTSTTVTLYTAIGHAVNVASRIEQQTKTLGLPILVSEDSQRAIAGALALRDVGEVQVKGITGPLRVFTPLDAPLSKGT